MRLQTALFAGAVAIVNITATPAPAAAETVTVYTCDWIAAHPAAAAQAHVTCDAAVFQAAVSSPAIEAPITPDAEGCQWLPSSVGRVGQGVFAWSAFEYANRWTYVGFYGQPIYTWYLQRTDHSNYTSGIVGDNSEHLAGVPANVYRWGAQNHSGVPQQWRVCYWVA
ncbi:MAG TPA: hypothetical protein VFC19_04510 [Candidatus Limnocylindrales bacterium]|nr:hypothetical protein [Candidatus Limnocylindrales bacterium]